MIGGSDCGKRLCRLGADPEGERHRPLTAGRSRTAAGSSGDTRRRRPIAEDQIVVAAEVTNAARTLASDLPGRGLPGADSPAFGQQADPDLRVAADRPGSLRARAALGAVWFD